MAALVVVLWSLFGLKGFFEELLNLGGPLGFFFWGFLEDGAMVLQEEENLGGGFRGFRGF